MGKIEHKMEIGLSAFNDILSRYQDIIITHGLHLQLDYESMQLYYALKALEQYMLDRMVEPNFKVVVDE